MKLMSMKQYMKMSKPALIRKIMKTLRAMPKKRLAMVCYNITKSKLPRLRTIRQKALPKPKNKKAFLALMKKGRRNATLWNNSTQDQKIKWLKRLRATGFKVKAGGKIYGELKQFSGIHSWNKLPVDLRKKIVMKR